jgi:ankyrin repeat protein
MVDTGISAPKRRRAGLCSALALLVAVVTATAASAQHHGHELHAAAERGDAARAQELIAAGADLDVADASGRTPLLIAVANDRLAVARRLIEAGADINGQAANRDSPWLLAGALGRTEMLVAMLATGRIDYAKRNRYGGNALIPACERGHVETVRLLLERSRIDVDHVNDLGWTALLEAVMLGDGGPRHREIVRLLIAHGVNVNLADRSGVSPLQHARRRGYREIESMLQTAGAR